MTGLTLSVVTLEEPRTALSTNYLKVSLAAARPANQLLEVEIGGLTAAGLQEAAPFSVF
jgi:hypothetical protein